MCHKVASTYITASLQLSQLTRRWSGVSGPLKQLFPPFAQGVRVISTPVNHYRTDGPVALRVEWKGLAVTYSGERCLRAGL